MKKQIKLTETDLKQVIEGAVKSILKEYDPHMAGLGAARGLEKGKLGPWNAAQKIMNRDRWDKSKMEEFQNGFERKPIQQNGTDLEEYTDMEKKRMYGRPYDEIEVDDFNEQPTNNIVGENHVKVTEEQLKGIIRESVNRVLAEIDWRTVANAADIAGTQSMDEKLPQGLRHKRTDQWQNFKGDVRPRMMKQYDLSNDEVSDAIKGKGPFYKSASRKALRNMDKLNADYDKFYGNDREHPAKYENGKWQ